MANIPLKTIKFPGLPDTYTVPQVDSTLAVSGAAADAKAVGDALATKAGATETTTALAEKANKNGYYDTMGVGLADNLTPYSADSGAEQSVPFINQGTGCGNGESVVDTGSYLQFKKKLGNTVGVNQLVKNGTFSTGDTTNWSTAGTSTRTVSGGVLTMQTSEVSALYQNVTLIKGHRYILCATLSATSGASVAFGIYKNTSAWYATNITADGAKHIIFRNIDASEIADTDTFDVRIRHNDTNSATITIERVWLIDLTLWFGSNDRIPAHLLSHPENWGRYYAGSLDYNAGTLDSADGTVMRSIGRNVWDEQTELGSLNNANGQDAPSPSRIRTKDYIPVIPNTTYFVFIGNGYGSTALGTLCYYDADKNFISTIYPDANTTLTTPSNAHFLRIGFYTAYGTTYKSDITISLYYPGESGYDQYYPYSVLAEVDTGSEVLRSAGAIADEKTPDGTITRRVGVVDLGTLTWTDNGGGQFFSSTLADAGNTDYSGGNVIFTKKYIGGNAYGGSTELVGCCGGSRIWIRDANYAGSPGDFKTSLSGNYLYYELATPTTEQGTAFAENIPCDDFGSLMWTQTKGIPQGNEIFYPVDYKASIDTLYNRVDGDMSRIVIDDDLEDYNTKTEDDAKFATKDAVGGTLRQLLSASETIDFDNTAYIDLGDCTYNTNQTGTNTYEAATSFSVPKANGTTNFICSNIATKAYSDDGKYGIRGYGSSGAVAIRVPINVASTPEGIKAAMKGVLLAYEKASS